MDLGPTGATDPKLGSGFERGSIPLEAIMIAQGLQLGLGEMRFNVCEHTLHMYDL